jgi:hypothetical protein
MLEPGMNFTDTPNRFIDHHMLMLHLFLSGVLLRIPAIYPAILRHLSQRPRANPLLASPEQRPEPLFLRHRQSSPDDSLLPQ